MKATGIVRRIEECVSKPIVVKVPEGMGKVHDVSVGSSFVAIVVEDKQQQQEEK